MDVSLTHDTYLNIFEDQVHDVMARVFHRSIISPKPASTPPDYVTQDSSEPMQMADFLPHTNSTVY